MAPSREDGSQEEKPPVILIGAGFSNLMAARFLQRESIPFLVYERLAVLGGVWNTIGNDTSKVQTEHATYSGLFDGEAVPDHSGEAYPSRRMVLQYAQHLCRKHGLDLKAQCSHEIIRVVPDGDYYKATAKNCLTGKSENIACRGTISAPGFFPMPNRFSWPGEDIFSGYISYGVAKDIDAKLFRGRKVMIIGHGAFGIENIRTATECGAAKAYLVSKRHSIVIPRECGFIFNFSPTPFDLKQTMAMLQPSYALLGMDCMRDLPTVQWGPDGSGIMSQRNSPISDLYFLAQHAGFCEQLDDDPKQVYRDSVGMASGKRVEVNVIVKSLGADLQPRSQLDDVFDIKIINGFWINTDPNHLVYITSSRSYGVRMMGATSNTLPMCSVLMAWCHFQAYPQDFFDIYPMFPTLTSLTQASGILGALNFLGKIPGIAKLMGLMNEVRVSKMHQVYGDPLARTAWKVQQEWEEWQQIPGGKEAQQYVK